MAENIAFFRMMRVLCFLAAVAGCGRQKEPTTGENRQHDTMQIPWLEKQGTATRLVVEGKPFLMIAGELHNSTCGGLATMRPVWKRMAAKNLNTVIATVSWELTEPEEGKFDFTLVDSMITGAREANLKLVLIWFASWKNAGSVYIPSWVKRDYEKYPRAKDGTGKPLEILSTFGEASCEADARAFAALMRHIKETDNEQQTVVMVQVENEAGMLDNTGATPGNARRDFSDKANAAYSSPVPPELLSYLATHKAELHPELHRIWAEKGFRTAGSWEEVFGKSSYKPELKDWKFYSFYTEELFMAWHYARYIEKVAAAGKAEYSLPMYVNAWLKQPFSYIPGKYPSGGPLPQVIDIWRAAAPSIDFIAPDIYTDEFVWVCEEYTRSGNPLFIPETRGGDAGAARAFYVFGEYSRRWLP
jgi:beta-galactosidase GanA